MTLHMCHMCVYVDYKSSPAHRCLVARNGLVNKVELVGFVTKML